MSGDFPKGSVWSEKERSRIIESIKDGFRNLKNPIDGSTLGIEIFSKEEIFSGPFMSKAPDLIPAAWSDSGFNLKKPSSYTSSRNGSCLKLEEGPVISGSEWGGTHKMEGFLLVSRGKTKIGNLLKNISIVDVFPTILTILNLPIPQDIDGRVIKETIN
jgi:predicted AlkP superfamily phosphohydrolase/phosphomutase